MSISQVPMFITIYGLASIVAAVVAYMIASAKHRDASHWATIAFLFPPAVLLTLVLRTIPPEHRSAHIVERKIRKYLDAD